MDYKTFEDKIIKKIQENKKTSKTIAENQKLVNEYFINNTDVNINKNFINRLNDTLLKMKKFSEAEKFLKNPSMSSILKLFRESDVLVKACEAQNKKAATWLLTMNINPNVRDKKGMTALMHASRYWDLKSVAKQLIQQNENQINLTDEDGNTALFHAVKTKDIFDILVNYNIDTTYRNQNGDTIFSHICKCHKPKLISSLFKYHGIVDLSVVNNEGKTPLMYLAESDNYTEIRALYGTGKDLNINYKNKDNETVVSQTINRYCNQFKGGVNATYKKVSEERGNWVGDYDIKEVSYNYGNARNMARTINALIDIGCDFNCEIDGDGNTPMMFFLMIQDYVSALNLLQYCKTLDLKKCNKYGISALDLASILTPNDFQPLTNVKDHLFVKINYQIFQSALESNETFDSEHVHVFDKTGLSVSPYSPPERILSLQSALSEGYFARNGEDGDVDMFDKVFGSMLRLQHPTRYQIK